MTKIIIISMIIATFLAGIGAIFLKLGATQFNLNPIDQIKNWKLITGLTLYGISAIIFLTVLKTSELSFAYPLVAMTYIWVILFSTIFLKETIEITQWTGIALILAGVIIINI